MKKLVSVIALFIILATSCNKSTINADIGEDFQPLKKGNWIMYEVDSIVWNDFFDPVEIDTFSSLVRIETDVDYKNEEGKKTYRIEKKSKKDTTDWSVDEVMGISLSSSGFKTLRNNKWYLTLATPVSLGSQWDKNAFNTEDEILSTYIDLGHLYSVNQNTFDTCVSILYEDYTSLINEDYHFEIYSKHIGMIYKEVKHLETEVDGEIKAGYTLEYKIVDWDVK